LIGTMKARFGKELQAIRDSRNGRLWNARLGARAELDRISAEGRNDL
jgi:hypothetical protein